jgi:hypothetical protein
MLPRQFVCAFCKFTQADVMIIIFCDFCQFSAFFSKPNVMITIFAKTKSSQKILLKVVAFAQSSLSKKRKIFR